MQEIKKDNKYKNGRIYKITDINYTECYIGSTIEKLCTRMAKHRYEYLQYKKGNKKKGKTTSYNLFDKYGYENLKIELIENFECNSKEELYKREGFHIQNNECINKNIAGRTHKEWYNDNKNKRLIYHKMHYNDNKSIILKKNQLYRTKNKNKISQQMQKYNIKNKDNITQYKKLHYKAKKIQKIMNVNLLPYLLKMRDFDNFFSTQIVFCQVLKVKIYCN